MRVLNWLNAPSPYAMPIGGPDGPVPKDAGMTNREVLALLIAKNGFKTIVTGWGHFSGPFGLTQEDAFLLMQMGPYLQGMVDAGIVGYDEFLEVALGSELKKHADAFEAAGKAEREAAAAREAEIARAAEAARQQAEDNALAEDDAIAAERASQDAAVHEAIVNSDPRLLPETPQTAS